jgi:hypothetical protein
MASAPVERQKKPRVKKSVYPEGYRRAIERCDAQFRETLEKERKAAARK